MSGVTWVYIMLGIYTVYCFYWGLKGYFNSVQESVQSDGSAIPLLNLCLFLPFFYKIVTYRLLNHPVILILSLFPGITSCQ